MSLKSRLDKVERVVGVGPVEGLRPPAETPEPIWRRALELLTALPADEFGGWSVAEVVAWCRERPGSAPGHLPDPLLDCLARAEVEAETGRLPPPCNQRGRLARADLGNWSEEQLIAFLRHLDAATGDDYLPWPYSTWLLEGISEHAKAQAFYHVCELRRGAITPEEYAAKLAKFLPPVVRADLEKTVQNVPDGMLGIDALHQAAG